MIELLILVAPVTFCNPFKLKKNKSGAVNLTELDLMD